MAAAAEKAKKAKKAPADKTASGKSSLYELLFREANDAILLINRDTGKIENANGRMLELTGYLEEELINQPVDMLFPTADGDSNVLPMRSQLFSQQLLNQSGFYEDVAIRKNDHYMGYVTLSVRTLSAKQTGDHKVSFCILHDIGEKKNMERDLIAKHSELTNAYVELNRAHIELKQAQEALVQAGKLAALGELAAGVAHELNQPLAGILGFAQELQEVLKDKKINDETINDFSEEIVKNSVRMKKIIQQLREFTRKSTEDYQLTDMESVIHESLKLLEKQFDARGITVDIEAETGLPQVYCNPFQIEQVFINLATNARDAIEAKGEPNGKINIKLKRSKTDNRFVTIEFKDNGIGMSQETQSRAVDPFYTTKEVGKGTGLGLSVSYGILSKIHGTMMIEGNPGRGTKFTIKLPIDYRKQNKEKSEE